MQNKGKELDFSGQNIYIGLDTHLRNWTATIRIGSDFFKTFSQNPVPKALSAYLNKNFPNANYYSAYEASFSGFWIHRELIKLGIKNIVVNPADIPTTDKEQKQKEDARDSRKIAEQLAASSLEAIHVPSIEAEGDRSILRFRRTLIKEIARNKNRVKSKLYYYGIEIPEQFSGKTYWSKRFTKWLQEVKLPTESGRSILTGIIETVEFFRKKQYQILKQIKELSESKKYKKNILLLLSIPGIGLVTAMSFLTEIEDILRFKNLDKFCSFVGLIPMTSSSGERDVVGSITKRQNKILRTLIIESSWVAIRTDPALMMTYQKYIKRMEPTRAIIRIAKKVLNRMRCVLKKQEIYEHSVVE